MCGPEPTKLPHKQSEQNHIYYECSGISVVQSLQSLASKWSNKTEQSNQKAAIASRKLTHTDWNMSNIRRNETRAVKNKAL